MLVQLLSIFRMEINGFLDIREVRDVDFNMESQESQARCLIVIFTHNRTMILTWTSGTEI